MEPISLGIMAVGAGMQLYGSLSSSGHAHEVAQLSQQKAAEEQAINKLKLQQMEVEGRRMQMENIRNTQKARALAMSAGVNQGAQFGTGLAGGLAGVTSKGQFNAMGVDAGLFFGREVGKHNDAISGINSQIAGVQGEMATDQAWSSLGGALIKAGPITGQISQSFGGGLTQTASNPYNSMPQAFGNNSWWQNA